MFFFFSLAVVCFAVSIRVSGFDKDPASTEDAQQCYLTVLLHWFTPDSFPRELHYQGKGAELTSFSSSFPLLLIYG